MSNLKIINEARASVPFELREDFDNLLIGSLSAAVSDQDMQACIKIVMMCLK